MSFLSPWSALWLLSLPLLVTFYLFRPEPRRVLLSTFFLWKKAVPESQGGVYAKRLRSNPLLWLQLLVLLALCGYLMRPASSWRGTLPPTSRVVLVVDTSASMNAGGAFPQAVIKVEAALDGLFGWGNLGSQPEVMLIAFDREPRILVPFTRDVAQLQQALAKLQASEVPDQLESLRPLLSSLISERKASIWLFGDHLPAELELPGLQFSHCGVRPAGNVALSAFTVELTPQDRKPLLFARLDNFSGSAEQRLLRIESLDRQNPEKVEALVHEQLITLPAGEGRTVDLSLPASRLSSSQATLFRASLKAPPGAAPDDFAIDDTAYSCAPAFGDERLTVAVTPELRAGFLLKALMAHPSVEVLDWKKLLAQPGETTLDLLVSSRHLRLPAQPVVRTRMLITENDPGADTPVEVLQATPGQLFVEQTGVQWERLRVQLDPSWPSAPTESVLLATASGPALTLGGVSQGQPTLSWRFPLAHSSLPLSPALPILTSRFLTSYVQPTASALPGSGSTGQRRPRPSGRDWSGAVKIRPRAGAALAGPALLRLEANQPELPRLTRSGLYQAELSNGSLVWIAVNLASARESALPWSDSDRAFALNSEGEAAGAGTTRNQYRETTAPLAFLALLLLFLEAFLFLRRGRP